MAAFDRVACPGSNSVAALPNNSETTSQREQTGNPKFQVEMMLVSGYAGIGKSALVQEIYKPITQKRGYFISGKFDQFGRNIPYSAIAHTIAQNYLVIGRTWLAACSWQTNYDLTLELYLETTEVAYLCGDFEQVEYWVAIVLQEAKTIPANEFWTFQNWEQRDR